MKKKKRIEAPFPYYGGKAKMGSQIAKLLDKANTDTYVEPFGGAANVLLNKRPHEMEIYSDMSSALTNFFRVVQREDSCEQLIDELRDLKPTKENFEKAFYIKRKCENFSIDFYIEEANSLIQKILRKCSDDSYCDTRIELLKQLKILCRSLKNEKNEHDEMKATLQTLMDGLQSIRRNLYIYLSDDEFYKIDELCSMIQSICAFDDKDFTMFIEDQWYTSYIDLGISDIEYAKATFLTYYLSRDGMGKAYSTTKNNLDKYQRRVCNLRSIQDRFQDVTICNMDAFMVIGADSNSHSGYTYNFETLLQRPNVTMYLDPSYLNKENKNLGEVYFTSFANEQEHREFLEAIVNAQAKVIVSNYDSDVYNEILSPENGWSKKEIPTTTSVGGKKNNRRLEVLWYNY